MGEGEGRTVGSAAEGAGEIPAPAEDGSTPDAALAADAVATAGAALAAGAVAATDGAVIPGPTGQQMTVKISGAASGGAYSLIEYSHRRGAPGPPPHVHREHEEAFYVLEGELTLAVGPDIVTVRAGQTAVVPRGQVHQPSNRSDRPVRFVFVSSPPMDEFFAELARLVSRTRGGGEPPASQLAELGERYDSIFTSLPAAGRVGLHTEGAGAEGHAGPPAGQP
jgi:mannose-6-phosphate isomerase-like protein (cupin superfamily)